MILSHRGALIDVLKGRFLVEIGGRLGNPH